MKITVNEITSINPRTRCGDLEIEINVDMHKYQAFDAISEIWENFGTEELQKWFAKEGFELTEKGGAR